MDPLRLRPLWAFKWQRNFLLPNCFHTGLCWNWEKGSSWPLKDAPGFPSCSKRCIFCSLLECGRDHSHPTCWLLVCESKMNDTCFLLSLHMIFLSSGPIGCFSMLPCYRYFLRDPFVVGGGCLPCYSPRCLYIGTLPYYYGDQSCI